MNEAEIYEDFQDLLNIYDKNSLISKSEYQFFIYRLIFLTFLEKSKFLSQHDDILKKLYDICSNLNLDYFQEVIKPIFLKLINNLEQKFSDKIQCDYKLNIRYLGNIFSIDDIIKLKSTNLPNGFWDKIFQVFSKYKWSIEESDVEFEDLIPKIFEYIYQRNLLEGLGTKKNLTGTVFTPPEVIERILDNTLYPYLQDILKRENLELDIRSIINDCKEIQARDLQKVRFLFEHLPNIRIIDNSCGGGAFLIKLKDKLLKIYDCLYGVLLSNSESSENVELFNPLAIILKNNIYGVDLSKLVINLVKMRFNLAYISYYINNIEGKKTIGKFEAPQLNFRRGNSLIGVVTKRDLLNLSKWRERTEQLSSKNNFLGNLKKYFQKTIQKETQKDNNNSIKVISEINRKFLLKIRDKYALNLKEEEFNNVNPFHWIIEFPEVFYHSKEISIEPGFDIIIGNPPYGKILSDVEKTILKKELRSLEGKMGSTNIASIFIERSLKQLKKGGYLGYIIPNTICRKDEFTNIRNIILEETHLQKIFDEGNPFKNNNVTLEMVDFIFKKEKSNSSMNYNIEIQIIRGDKIKKHIVQKKIFHKYNWFVLHYDEILEKLNRNSEKLGHYGRFLSAKRPSKLNVKMRKDEGNIISVKGRCIKPFYLIKDLKIEKNEKVEKYIASLKYPLIILPEISNSTKASLCQKDCVPISGVVIWSPNENAQTISFFNSYLLLLLNSRVFAFYFNKYIINRSHLTTHLDSTYLERLPVKSINNVKIFAYLSKFLLFLHEKRTQNSELIDFYKNEIVNPIIFSLYFFESTKTYDIIRRMEGFINFKFDMKNLAAKNLDNLKELKKVLEANEYILNYFKTIKKHRDIMYIERFVKKNIERE